MRGDLVGLYEKTLSNINFDCFEREKDKYSGVFLPVPFEEYLNVEKKIMVVGRETAGWNTHNKITLPKNKIFRFKENGVGSVINEAIEKYERHLKLDSKGRVKVTSRSRFKQFYFKIAKEMKISPKSIIYSNLFSWDYNDKSPVNRPQREYEEVKRLSLELLAHQISICKPDIIVFATGVNKITDTAIKELFNDYFDGYKTVEDSLVRGKFWEFEGAGIKCYRIAHPRATHGHGQYRELVINRIKDELNESCTR